MAGEKPTSDYPAQLLSATPISSATFDASCLQYLLPASTTSIIPVTPTTPTSPHPSSDVKRVLSPTHPLVTTKVIVLSGKLGTGKDFIGDQIFQALRNSGHNPLKIGAADLLKIFCIAQNSECNYHNMYEEKTAATRQILRDESLKHKVQYGDDIWVNYVKIFIEIFSKRGVSHFIIQDCRYKNEMRVYRELNSYIIRIEAPLRNRKRLEQEARGFANPEEWILKASQDPSECDLDDVPVSEFDYYLLNDIGQEDNYTYLLTNYPTSLIP